MFIKTGDGKINTIIKEDELTEEQKNKVNAIKDSKKAPAPKKEVAVN